MFKSACLGAQSDASNNKTCLKYRRNAKTTSLLPEMGNFAGLAALRRT